MRYSCLSSNDEKITHPSGGMLILSLLLLLPTLSFTQSYKDQVFTDYFKKDGAGWNAGDGTISVPLKDGRSLWLFGDSYVNAGVAADNTLPCLPFYRNSMMVQDQQNEFHMLKDEEDNVLVIRTPTDEDFGYWYWPSGGIADTENVYLFWERYTKDTLTGAPLFKGMVIAELSLPDLQLKNIQDLQYPIEYGMTILHGVTDDNIYIYGRQKDTVWFNDRPLGFYKPLVARCKMENIYGNWEFYAGDHWSANPEEAIAIARETNIEYTVFEKEGSYYLFYQENGFLLCGAGRKMYIYQSNNPEGPFDNRVVVYTMEDQFQGEYFRTYNGQAHPQFTENNELLISYNINQVCPNPCEENPFSSSFNADHYRPQFARIPYVLFTTTVAAPNRKTSKEIAVYPNPFREELTFKKQGLTPLSISLFDNLGRKIGSFEMKNQTHTLSTNNLAKGIYFYQFLNVNDQIMVTGKVIRLVHQ